MTKLLIIIDNLGSGGAQKQVYLLAREFAQLKIEFKIVTYHHYTKDFYQEELTKLGVDVIRLDGANYLKRFLSARKLVLKEAPKTILSFLYGANILFVLD